MKLWLWFCDFLSRFCLSSLDTSRISGDCPKAVGPSDRNPKFWKDFWKDTRLNPKPFFPPSVLGFIVTLHEHCPTRKALPGFFPLYFQLPYLPEETKKPTCFQQAGSSTVEGTSRAVLGSSDQQKVPPSLSLFLKVKKTRTLLYYLRKGPEYRPFGAFLPVPSAYRPWAQISNHGRASSILKTLLWGFL
jgi:hypothetical protein